MDEQLIVADMIREHLLEAWAMVMLAGGDKPVAATTTAKVVTTAWYGDELEKQILSLKSEHLRLN